MDYKKGIYYSNKENRLIELTGRVDNICGNDYFDYYDDTVEIVGIVFPVSSSVFGLHEDRMKLYKYIGEL